jgi:hypothetical protein
VKERMEKYRYGPCAAGEQPDLLALIPEGPVEFNIVE